MKVFPLMHLVPHHFLILRDDNTVWRVRSVPIFNSFLSLWMWGRLGPTWGSEWSPGLEYKDWKSFPVCWCCIPSRTGRVCLSVDAAFPLDMRPQHLSCLELRGKSPVIHGTVEERWAWSWLVEIDTRPEIKLGDGRKGLSNWDWGYDALLVSHHTLLLGVYKHEGPYFQNRNGIPINK